MSMMMTTRQPMFTPCLSYRSYYISLSSTRYYFYNVMVFTTTQTLSILLEWQVEVLCHPLYSFDTAFLPFFRDIFSKESNLTPWSCRKWVPRLCGLPFPTANKWASSNMAINIFCLIFLYTEWQFHTITHIILLLILYTFLNFEN